MIEDYQFGSIKIDGQTFDHDIQITPLGILKWWRDEGHRVGLEDLEEALKQNPEIIVIGTGASGMMEVPSPIKKYLEEKNIEVINKKTGQAVKDYNQLAKKGQKVIALFHLTC